MLSVSLQIGFKQGLKLIHKILLIKTPKKQETRREKLLELEGKFIFEELLFALFLKFLRVVLKLPSDEKRTVDTKNNEEWKEKLKYPQVKNTNKTKLWRISGNEKYFCSFSSTTVHFQFLTRLNELTKAAWAT